MGRSPHIPTDVKTRPFTLKEARHAGLTRHSLSGKAWRRIGAELYCWNGWRHDPLTLIHAWKQLLPCSAVFGGTTAAWLWGIEIYSTRLIEVIVPPNSGLRSRAGLNVKRSAIRTDEVADTRGVRVTTVLRTLCDICDRLTPVEALVSLDMALHIRRTTSSALMAHADFAAGRPGAKRLRQLAMLCAPAESPMETRLRWLLLQGGLPKPEVQVDLRNDGGQFIGRADLCYPAARLVIEYDGGNHRDRLVDDDRRQNLIVKAGFNLLRFTAADLDRPEIVQAQVRTLLQRRV